MRSTTDAYLLSHVLCVIYGDHRIPAKPGTLSFLRLPGNSCFFGHRVQVREGWPRRTCTNSLSASRTSTAARLRLLSDEGLARSGGAVRRCRNVVVKSPTQSKISSSRARSRLFRSTRPKEISSARRAHSSNSASSSRNSCELAGPGSRWFRSSNS